MSQENVEIVKRVMAAFNKRDIGAFMERTTSEAAELGAAVRCEAEVGERVFAVPVAGEPRDLAVVDLEEVRSLRRSRYSVASTCQSSQACSQSRTKSAPNNRDPRVFRQAEVVAPGGAEPGLCTSTLALTPIDLRMGRRGPSRTMPRRGGATADPQS